MSTCGWVKIWRCSTDDITFQDDGLWRFWCWCLLKASHKKTTHLVGKQLVELEPGQFVFGRKKAALELKKTERCIRTYLKVLKKDEKVTIKVTNKFSIITIVKWDTYQNQNGDSDHQSDQQVTSNRPTSDQQVTTNKNDKECKECKEEIPANKFADDSIEVQLSKHLFLLIQDRNPKAKKPDFQKWAKHIDLMIRRDNRTEREVRAAIDWCQNDDFWFSNILSTDNLRKKYDKLYAAAQREKVNGQPKRYINNLKACQEFIDERF